MTLEDVENDVIRINKAKVQEENNEWVTKSTKTTASTREIIIPMEIDDKIRKQEYIYKGYPRNITNFLSSAQKKLNIPHFSVHKLRHYFASKMSAMNISEEDKNKKTQREASQKLGNLLFSK